MFILEEFCLKHKVYVIKGQDEIKSELLFCYVNVSAVAALNGHPFCASQSHILLRLKLLILQERNCHFGHWMMYGNTGKNE